MNKKLFSWKALAGFALLAAISMTSCTNSDDPIDPLNPNQGKTTPVAIVDGDYDVVLNNIKKAADVATAWANVPAATKTAIDKKKTVNVAINTSAYALEKGVTLNLPAFFSAPDKKVVNIYFIGTFASQTVDDELVPFKVNADTNLAGAEVNFYFATDAVWFDLKAQQVRATLNAVTTNEFTRFDVDANTGKERLGITEGVTVDAIHVRNGSLTAGSKDQIVAKLILKDETLIEGKGAEVGTIKDEKIYVDGLMVIANATIKNVNKTSTMKKIAIANGFTATMNETQPNVEAFEGIGDDPSTVELKGDTWDKQDLAKVKSVKNIILKGNSPVAVNDFSIFERVTFNIPVDAYGYTVSHLSFKKHINFYVDDETGSIMFDNVAFAKTTNLLDFYSTNTVAIPTDDDMVALFEKDPDNNANPLYSRVKDDKQSNISATNKGRDVSAYVQYRYTSWAAIQAAGIDWNAKKQVLEIAEVVEAKDALDAAQKAYDQKCTEDGTKATYNSDCYQHYKACYEKLYGNVVDKNYGVDWTKKADFEVIDETTGLYWKYALEIDWVNSANAKLKNSYVFAICYHDRSADIYLNFDPNPIEVTFNECTFGGSALTKNGFNKLLYGETFHSAEEAWYSVNIDGTTYPWKKDNGTGLYFLY